MTRDERGTMSLSTSLERNILDDSYGSDETALHLWWIENTTVTTTMEPERTAISGIVFPWTCRGIDGEKPTRVSGWKCLRMNHRQMVFREAVLFEEPG